MTKSTRRIGSLALALAGLLSTGGAFAQTWDLDACASLGGTNCTAGGSTVSISAYYSNGASSNFQTGTVNATAGSGWMGIISKNGSNVAEDTTSSPHHAIDNYGSSGATYAEMALLSFTKAVDLNNITAVWNNGGGTGASNFQLWRWNNTGSSAPNALTSYTADTMTGWTAVTTTSGDFKTLSQAVSDNTYFSSYWLVTTAFGGSGDAFKLGQVTAAAVCTGTNVGTATGACGAPATGAPEPMSLALFGIAALGAGVARRRALAQRA